jgi:hypothetical protein
MKNLLLLLGSCLIASSTLTAAIKTLPRGLSEGDPYRLVFVTAGSIQATSDDITVYNNFVESQVAASPELVDLNTTWTAVVSTPTVSARENTETDTGATIPFYALDGDLLASSDVDLWDGPLADQIDRTQLDTTYAGLVWSGTNIDGSSAAGAMGSGTNVVVGRVTASSSGGWINLSSTAQNFNYLRIYAMSGVLIAPPNWAGYLTGPEGYVDTTPWMGFLYVEFAPFIWSVELGKWLFIEESAVTDSGGWVYTLNPSP